MKNYICSAMRIYRDLSEIPEFKNAVLTIGSFDGVHTGHQKIIERVRQIAAANGGESVLITFHPHPRFVLAPDSTRLRLLSTIEEKIKLLEHYGIDHLVIVPFTDSFYQQSPEDYLHNFLLDKFNPHTIVIGYDHRFGKNRTGDIAFLRRAAEQEGFRIEEIQKQEVDEIAVSSTKVRQALSTGAVKTAAVLLQHPFTLNGTVVRGQQIGKTLGFPTANIQVNNPYKLIPPKGIYAVWVVHKNQKYGGMLYIGDRPTLPQYNNITIEVNIFNFNQEIYGDSLEILFVDHIREDQQMSSLAALSAQLAKDEIAARAILQVEKKKSPKVAIVILNYNGVEHLRTYLPSVLKHQSPEAEIWVADNGSSDDSLLVLEKEFPQVKVIRLAQNFGFAEGYNQALQQLDQEYFLLLNSDVEVTAEWTEQLLKEMEADPGVGACQPKVLSHRQRQHFEHAGAAGGWVDRLGYPFCRGRLFTEVEEDRGQYDAPAEIFWASGCALLVRADLFRQLGGLDGSYFAHMEEIDFCWRLKRAGYKVMVYPESVVYHLGGGTLAYQNSRKTYLNFRNSLTTLYKNEQGFHAYYLVFLRLLLDGLAGLQFLVKGEIKNVWAIIRAHWHFFGNWGKLRRQKKEDQGRIEKVRIGPARIRQGRYSGSIVWAFFGKGKKRFSDLKHQ